MTDLLGIGQTAEGLSRPLTKLIEVCAAGIGKLYEPIYIRKMADAKSYAIGTLSESIENNQNVSINCSFEGITLLPRNDINLESRINHRICHEETRKQKNIESIIGQTYEILNSEAEVSDEQLDIDWITRYFSITGEISNQQMQLLWAKILSGEITNPGTYSLRTLELLRNVSQKEAETFVKVAKYIIKCSGMHILFNDPNIYKKYKMSILDFTLLNEVGLLTLESLTRTVTLQSNDEFPFVYCEILMILSNKSDNVITNNFPLYKLTKSGEELYQILNNEYDINYIFDILNWFQNHKFDGGLYKIKSFNEDGHIEYDNEPISIPLK